MKEITGGQRALDFSYPKNGLVKANRDGDVAAVYGKAKKMSTG